MVIVRHLGVHFSFIFEGYLYLAHISIILAIQKSGELKNSLYFDIGRWDLSYFPRKDISAIKSLPASFFRTLQITLLTKNPGDDFCIRNIEFGKIKVKTV